MATAALIEEVAEEVAENLEEAAAATRNIDSRAVGYFLGGICVGVAIGFYFGYRWNKEKIRAEAFKESEEEVSKMKDYYQQKTMVAIPKPSVDDLVAEKGYLVTEVEERPLKPPVPIIESLTVTDEIRIHERGGWDFPTELRQRDPELPYVIHQNEFNEENNNYSQVTYTYYAIDDVLTGEDGRPLPHADMIVGQDNLKWGHGSDDIDVVFVRNDKLELEMEICRLHSSYEEDVLGLENDSSD
jgi:hypothetical protein